MTEHPRNFPSSSNGAAPLAEVSSRSASEGASSIVLQGVSVFYGEVIGLSQVSIELAPGITGLVGPNGSGKSTLMRVLTGLVSPLEGSARVFGGDPFRQEEIRARIAFVPATEAFFRELSGRKNLEVAFLMRGLPHPDAKAATTRALELSGLTDAAHRSYGTWSRGMRQRLKLGLALASNAELVLLDEPFLGVDPPSRRELRDLIVALGEAGRTVLVSSHVLHEIESLTDRVGVLARGRLLGFGKIDALLLELRDRHPHRVEVELEDPRRLAAALLAQPHIREVEIVGISRLEFVTEEPALAYRELTEIVARLNLAPRRIRTIDGSLEAVFHHITAAGARRL